MTSSAPGDRTRPTFDVLHTRVTSGPNALAGGRPTAPTPPDAPTTSTLSPGLTCALSRTACSAVAPEIGTAAACSKVMFVGLRASFAALATANSGNEPPSQTP